MIFLKLLHDKKTQNNKKTHTRAAISTLRDLSLTGLMALVLSLVGLPLASATNTSGADSHLIHPTDAPALLEIEAAHTVDETVTAVSNLLKSHRFKILLMVNHMAAADSVGLKLRPTKVIYAQTVAAVEHKLRKDSASVFVDLPLKFLVFEDVQGKVQIR